MFVALCIVALVLAAIDLIRTNAASLPAWAVGALATALLVKALG